MLTRLDETLRHQAPTTFDRVASGDPRFYDRYWFAVYDPSARLALVTGMGLYSNMNVLDGYAVAQSSDHRQHNLRLSRALRPDIDTSAVGPLSISVEEPFTRLRLRLDDSALSPISFDLVWDAATPPIEEEPYFRTSRGRVVDDYRRYDQIGRAGGWIAAGGERVEVRRWWAGRDHSWGVRPGMGVPEPITGESPPADTREFTAVWFLFSTDGVAGMAQMRRLGDVRTRLGGQLHLLDRTPVQPLTVRDIEVDTECYAGTDRFSVARLLLTTDDEHRWDIEARPLLRSWSMDGAGYDHGFADGAGLGAHRGAMHTEHDIYDLADPEEVVRDDGSRRRPWQRETPVAVSVDGQPGTGHLVILRR